MADLALPIQKQQQFNWCWAAVSSSIARFYQDPDWQEQCAVATAVLNVVLGGANCCPAGAAPAANVPWDLRKALSHIGHLADIRPRLAFNALHAQVQQQRPVACRIIRPGLVAHFVVVVGCAETAQGQQWVTVADPSPAVGDTTHLLYSDFCTSYDADGRWDQTYLTR